MVKLDHIFHWEEQSLHVITTVNIMFKVLEDLKMNTEQFSSFMIYWRIYSGDQSSQGNCQKFKDNDTKRHFRKVFRVSETEKRKWRNIFEIMELTIDGKHGSNGSDAQLSFFFHSETVDHLQVSPAVKTGT